MSIVHPILKDPSKAAVASVKMQGVLARWARSDRQWAERKSGLGFTEMQRRYKLSRSRVELLKYGLFLLSSDFITAHDADVITYGEFRGPMSALKERKPLVHVRFYERPLCSNWQSGDALRIVGKTYMEGERGDTFDLCPLCSLESKRIFSQ